MEPNGFLYCRLVSLLVRFSLRNIWRFEPRAVDPITVGYDDRRINTPRDVA